MKSLRCFQMNEKHLDSLAPVHTAWISRVVPDQCRSFWQHVVMTFCPRSNNPASDLGNCGSPHLQYVRTSTVFLYQLQDALEQHGIYYHGPYYELFKWAYSLSVSPLSTSSSLVVPSVPPCPSLCCQASLPIPNENWIIWIIFIRPILQVTCIFFKLWHTFYIEKVWWHTTDWKCSTMTLLMTI